MVNGQLLTECADLGTGQRSHDATMRIGTDNATTEARRLSPLTNSSTEDAMQGAPLSAAQSRTRKKLDFMLRTGLIDVLHFPLG